MFFTCEDGRKCEVGLAHTTTKLPRYPGRELYTTKIWLRGTARNGSPIDISAQSVCSPEDQFSRKIGRARARAKFLPLFEEAQVSSDSRSFSLTTAVRSEFSREDRRVIYGAIFPEYRPHKQTHKKKAVLSPKALHTLEKKLSGLNKAWMVEVAPKQGVTIHERRGSTKENRAVEGVRQEGCRQGN